MPHDEERVGGAAEETEGGAPGDDVAHHGDVALDEELMDVAQLAERNAHALVDVAPRRIHLRDPHRDPLPHAEMAAFEGEEIAELEEAEGAPWLDDALAGEGGRGGVRADVAREIEDALERRGDARFDDDRRQITSP